MSIEKLTTTIAANIIIIFQKRYLIFILYLIIELVWTSKTLMRSFSRRGNFIGAVSMNKDTCVCECFSKH